MNIVEDLSPNFGPRRDGKTPRFLVLHYTATETAAEALRLLKHPPHEGSSHYLIDTDGTVTRLVREEDRAWHAGLSYWEGERDVNSASIGIEIQNPGAPAPYPEHQMRVVKNLCLRIIADWHILPQHVIGHSDVAPSRKIDPGYLFPWEYLAAHGVGLWPAADDGDDLDSDILPLLHAYGYNPEIPAEELIKAFQLHFEPEVYKGQGVPGQPTARTLARIKSLLRQRG